ncbi:MAG: GNAT family N-acetyltransferase [Azoarcus sp.]|jgi:GNAT superfamily N-acetyltransferase|nr:GNAT family N-acetyltransferase [Azoarcus sp.]
MDIRQTTFDEALAQADVNTLLTEYAREASSFGNPEPNIDAYKQLEDAGIAILLCAYVNGEIVGFCILTVFHQLQYDRIDAFTEALFVRNKYRNTGAGASLLRRSGRIAKEIGARSYVVTAPTGGVLHKAMERSKLFKESGRIFMRRL